LRENDERHFKELMETIKRLEATIATRDRTINEKDQTIKELSSKNLEMQQRMNALEAIVAVKEDLEKKVELANQLIQKISEAKEKL
jgi:chromosome segregation ATPase